MKKLLEALKKDFHDLADELGLLKVIIEIVVQVVKLDGDNILFDFLGTPINMVVEVMRWFWCRCDVVLSILPICWPLDNICCRLTLWSQWKREYSIQKTRLSSSRSLSVTTMEIISLGDVLQLLS